MFTDSPSSPESAFCSTSIYSDDSTARRPQPRGPSVTLLSLLRVVKILTCTSVYVILVSILQSFPQ